MTPLNAGNCDPWPINTAVGCWDVPADTPPATVEMWQRVASEYLWAMTGRRLGPSCPVTVRPCRKSCFDASWLSGRFLNQGQYLSTGGFIPYMMNGRMYNATVCGCDTDCHCGPELCEIDLPGPVFDIQSVTIDGAVVDPATYGIYDGRYLTRLNTGVATDEAKCWPTCQDMTLPPTEVGTFAVTYRSGLALSSMATMAVTELTAHFIRGCNGGCGCGSGTRQNLQRLSRQGVDLEFADPQELFTDGRTGIETVDFFIRAANPYGVADQLRVISPDSPKRPRQWNGVG